MAAIQTAVAATMTRAFAGMLSDSSRIKDVRSYVNAEASANMIPGRMVKQGATDDACLLPTAATVLLGVVVHSHAYARDIETDDLTGGIKPKMTVGVLNKGRIWVEVDEAVAPGNAVRVRITSAGGGQGTFRKTAGAGLTVNLSAFATWRTSTTGAGIAELEIDMTSAAALATADA